MQSVLSEKSNWFLNSTSSAWKNAGSSGVILSCFMGIVIGAISLVSPLLAIVLGLAVLVAATSFSKPVVLCYLVVSVTVLFSGIERGRFFPILSGNEVSLLGAFALALMIVLGNRQRKIVLPSYFLLAFIFLIGGSVFIPIVTYMLQGTDLTMANAFKMVGPLQYFILAWLFVVLPQGEADRRKIVWWMLAFGLLVAVVGLLQGVGVGFINRLLENLYSSSHELEAAAAGRVTSLLGAWNSLGIFMMAIILMCWAILFEVEPARHRWLVMGIMAASLLCLVASGSFAGILGTGLGLILLQLLSRRTARTKPVYILSFFGIILAILVFYPFLQPLIEKRLAYQYRLGGIIPQTLLFRFQVWNEIFIPAIKQHFPWPVYPTVPSYYAWQFEESQYILLLFRTGLIGFTSYLIWIGITIAWLVRRFRKSAGFDRALTSVALTLVIVLVVAGFTNEVFSFAGSIDYLWMMLALVANSQEKI